jgi:hypothetical protein
MEIGMSHDLVGTKRTFGSASTVRIVPQPLESEVAEVEPPEVKRPKIQEVMENVKLSSLNMS